MTDNDRKCVNELYKKIVMSHDPYYCDPDTLPMPALCALIKDSVMDKNLALNTYNVKMCEAERKLRELKEKFDKYRLAVESLLEVPPAARENIDAIERSYEHSKAKYKKLEEFHDEIMAELGLPVNGVANDLMVARNRIGILRYYSGAKPTHKIITKEKSDD